MICTGIFLRREGITRVLEGAFDVDVVGWAASQKEALVALERNAPDVLVVDAPNATLHTDEGIRLASQLNRDHPAMGVVILGPSPGSHDAERLFVSGARGRAYLLAERLSSGDELLAAIREVARGGVVVHPAVVDTLLRARSSSEGLLDRLTPRERAVLALVARGLSNAAIAEHFSLSKRGVEKHIGAIFSCFRLHDSPGISPRVVAALIFLQAESAAS